MSSKTSKSIIGAFLVGAVGLAVTGVLVFGSGKLLTKKYPFVMYFEGSVKGLNVGSPVVFRGVEVGSVKSIKLRGNPKDFSVRIPVIVEFEPEKIEMGEVERDPYKNLPRLVKRGLRAQLETKSFVTQQLQIALDYHPDEKARVIGEDTKYPEIPTIPSTFEKITKTVEDLPLTEMAMKLSASLAGIEKVVNSPEVMETLHELKFAVGDARKLLQNLDSHIEPLMFDIKETVMDAQKMVSKVEGQIEPLASNTNYAITAARRAFEQGEKTLSLEGGVPGKLGSSAKRAIDSIRKAADATRPAIIEVEKTLANVKTLTAQDSAVSYQISNALKELSAAARSIRVWAEYLERHPEALIRGKGGSKRR
jgi:paraquat-inducible protein B